jgi:hypothetical protein
MKNINQKVQLIKEYEQEVLKARDYYIENKRDDNREDLDKLNVELKAIKRIKDILGID